EVDPSMLRDARPRGGAILSSVPEADEPARAVSTAAGLGAERHAAGAGAAREEIAAWRSAWGRAYARLSEALASMDARERSKLVRDLAQETPTLASEPDFRR